MLHSELTRSTAVGVNAACPHEDLAPLMDMIDDRRRENDSRHLSQHIHNTIVGIVPFGCHAVVMPVFCKTCWPHYLAPCCGKYKWKVQVV